MKNLIFTLILVSCSTPKRITTIEEAIASKNDEYRQCFTESDSYRGTKFIEKGSLVVGFKVDKNGKVVDRKLKSSDYKDANLHACILMIVKGIQFPLPPNGDSYETAQTIKMGIVKE